MGSARAARGARPYGSSVLAELAGLSAPAIVRPHRFILVYSGGASGALRGGRGILAVWPLSAARQLRAVLCLVLDPDGLPTTSRRPNLDRDARLRCVDHSAGPSLPCI